MPPMNRVRIPPWLRRAVEAALVAGLVATANLVGARMTAGADIWALPPGITGALILSPSVLALAVVPTTYIGELNGAPESARIAFVVEGDKFVAYVCSGDKPFNEGFSRWLRGDVKDGKMSVTVDEIQLTATLKDDRVSGTLKKGTAHEFTAKA